jgi:hypothetical protein
MDRVPATLFLLSLTAAPTAAPAHRARDAGAEARVRAGISAGGRPAQP